MCIVTIFACAVGMCIVTKFACTSAGMFVMGRLVVLLAAITHTDESICDGNVCCSKG